MDEPTAALGVRETAAVEALIRRLRDAAVTVLLVSHDMAQVLRWRIPRTCCAEGRPPPGGPSPRPPATSWVGLITGAIEGAAHA